MNAVEESDLIPSGCIFLKQCLQLLASMTNLCSHCSHFSKVTVNISVSIFQYLMLQPNTGYPHDEENVDYEEDAIETATMPPTSEGKCSLCLSENRLG